MSFEQHGFLSPEIGQQIASIRQAHAEWFNLSDTFNRIAQRIILIERDIESEHGYSDYRVVAMLYFTRATSSFQAALLLLERGMISEANTIIRSLIETMWVLAGLTKTKQDFVKELASADYAERKAAGNWYLNNPKLTENVTEEAKAQMKAFVEKLEAEEIPLKKLVFHNVAFETGLGELYAMYRHLSHHYAHPSLTAASIFTITGPGEDDKNIFWNQQYGLGSVVDSMGYLCSGMIAAVLAINDAVPTDNVGAEMATAFAEYKRLAALSVGDGDT